MISATGKQSAALEPTPPVAPFDLLTGAIRAARTHIDRMDPQSEKEIDAHSRAGTGLDKLNDLLASIEDAHHRQTATAAALAINLASHPAPWRAHEDHLVRPLLIAASSIASMRAVKPWLDQWLHNANNAVLADLVSQHAERRGGDS